MRRPPSGRRALRAPHRAPRWARVVMALMLGTVVGVAAVSTAVLLTAPSGAEPGSVLAAPSSGPSTPRSPGTRSDQPVRVPAREVLRRWDAARATAWRRADAAALAGLYTPGSVAGLRDVAALRAWADRGVRVDRLTTQVLGLRVVDEGRGRLLLRVTDRLFGVTGDGVALPDDAVSTRLLELRWRGGWRVASVSDV